MSPKTPGLNAPFSARRFVAIKSIEGRALHR